VRAWARAGFEAFGLDLAPSAIRLAQEKTAGAGLAAQFHLGDFLADEPPQPFDWLFEHTLFCAIDPTRRADYVQAVLRWLRPAGQFLAVHYLIPDTEGPPFGTTREEVLERFSPHFDLLEDWVPRSYPNRTGLEWMLWWRRKRFS
jgi:SAM-dependent methyltransferase